MNDVRQLTRLVKTATGSEQTRAAARLMSFIADNHTATPQILADLHDCPHPRLVLGITGPPGAGKSTLVDAIIHEIRRRTPERKLGIIAVDPSSPTTGGAILGDRIRMMRHAADPNVYIRSLASRGQLGGLTTGIAATIRVLGALGSETVLIETVGVGQSEVDIRNAVDIVAIVLAPGFGDDIQLHKAGLLEVGDIFIVNKSDTPGAKEFASSLESMLEIGRQVTVSLGATEPTPSPSWTEGAQGGSPTGRGEGLSLDARASKQVLLTCAANGQGIPEFIDELTRRQQLHEAVWADQRSITERSTIRQAILQHARQILQNNLQSNGAEMSMIEQILSGRRSIDQAAMELLERAARNANDTTRHSNHE